jgi:HSP20 family protein
MRSRLEDIVQFFDEVESAVAGFWELQMPSVGSIWSPATDVFMTSDEVCLIVEVPGVERENLKIAVSPVLVEVSGVRPTPDLFRRAASFYELEIAYGVFRKRIALPCRVVPRGVKAELKDGVLSLRLRRSAPQRQIAIDVKEAKE